MIKNDNLVTEGYPTIKMASSSSLKSFLESFQDRLGVVCFMDTIALQKRINMC